MLGLGNGTFNGSPSLLVTLGFGIGSSVAGFLPGIDYALLPELPHYTLSPSLMHFTLLPEAAQHTLED